MTVDVHRHALTPRLYEALAARAATPRIRAGRLEVANEAPAAVALESGGDVLATLRADGLDRGMVALSAALGIEALPADEAAPVLDAWRADIAELPEGIAGWDAGTDATAAHLCLPATELLTPDALDRAGPILEALERRGGVLFVHPGPAAAGRVAAGADRLPRVPAVGVAGVDRARPGAAPDAQGPLRRPRRPRPRAPRAHRRARRPGARTGPPHLLRHVLLRPGCAAQAVARVVGEEQIVYGSDHPWAGRAGAHEAFPTTYSTINPRQLMETER